MQPRQQRADATPFDLDANADQNERRDADQCTRTSADVTYFPFNLNACCLSPIEAERQENADMAGATSYGKSPDRKITPTIDHTESVSLSLESVGRDSFPTRQPATELRRRSSPSVFNR
jgi:hypothetical protein